MVIEHYRTHEGYRTHLTHHPTICVKINKGYNLPLAKLLLLDIR